MNKTLKFLMLKLLVQKECGEERSKCVKHYAIAICN